MPGFGKYVLFTQLEIPGICVEILGKGFGGSNIRIVLQGIHALNILRTRLIKYDSGIEVPILSEEIKKEACQPPDKLCTFRFRYFTP